MVAEQVPTGIKGLDHLLGGFRVGDNVILEVSVATPPHRFLDAVMEAAVGRGDRVQYVAFDASAATMHQRLERFGGRVTLVDCFRHGKNATGGPDAAAVARADTVVVETPQFPDEFRKVLQGFSEMQGRNVFIVDSLSGMAMLWGDENRVARFYSQVCPRLFDAGDLAIWVLHRGVHEPSFHAKIGHIAQVVLSLDLQDGVPCLTVERAAGRTSPRLRRPIPYHEEPTRFVLADP